MLEVILNFLSNSYVGQPTLHTRKIKLIFANRQSYILHSIKVTIQCIRKDHKEVFGRK